MGTKENLVEILDLGDRGEWFEIVNDDGAKFAEKATQTAVHYTYTTEFKIEDGHPRRWFVLLTGEEDKEIGRVCVAVLEKDVELKDVYFLEGKQSLVTGHRNLNPFPEFEFEISELSDAIGLEIVSEFMYNSPN